MMKKNI